MRLDDGACWQRLGSSGHGTLGTLHPVRGVDLVPVVFVVDAENKVSERVVKADRAIGGEWLITAGLSPGERVVLDGLQKVKPGGVVKPTPAAEQAMADEKAAGKHASGAVNEVAQR